MIDYPDLRKQCEEDTGRAHVLNATVLRLLDIIAVAKDGFNSIINTTYSDRNGGWMRYRAKDALDEIAKLENE